MKFFEDIKKLFTNPKRLLELLLLAIVFSAIQLGIVIGGLWWKRLIHF